MPFPRRAWLRLTSLAKRRKSCRWCRPLPTISNSFGITSVVNATGDLAELELYAALRDRGMLTVRTRTSFGSVAVQHHLTPAFLADSEHAHDGSIPTTGCLANLVKFFADGASAD